MGQASTSNVVVQGDGAAAHSVGQFLGVPYYVNKAGTAESRDMTNQVVLSLAPHLSFTQKCLHRLVIPIYI